MEQCPNCSTPARPGAKFCTTCGFRFDAGDEGHSATAPDAGTETIRPGQTSDTPDDDPEPGGGWPSALTPPEARPNDQRSPSGAVADRSDTDTAQSTDYTGFWPEPSSDPWPAPVTVNSEVTEREDPALELDCRVELASSAPAFAESAARSTSARDNAHELLDRLRDAIDSINAETPLDLSGVVSDLEVAVTPPGALPPDDIAELREALFAARERPRDIDTVVDLTRRIDALVALVIAYDRTIAAIERSLEALKRAEQPADTKTPSPGSTGEGSG